jgi:hypothetical protein
VKPPVTRALATLTVAPSGDVVAQVVDGVVHEAVAVPRHAPELAHTSPVVHAIVSSQLAPTRTDAMNERDASSQVYPAHAVGGDGGVGIMVVTQPRALAIGSPGTQRSTPVQYRPSSHVASVAVWLARPAAQRSTVHATVSSGTSVSSLLDAHPLIGSQRSRVQGLPSSQRRAAPPAQVPAAQRSPVRQAEVEQVLPSTRRVETQRPPTTASSVQGLPSLHGGA